MLVITYRDPNGAHGMLKPALLLLIYFNLYTIRYIYKI